MSGPADLTVRSTRIVTPDGIVPGSIIVHAGRIVEVAPYKHEFDALELIDAGDAAILPGIVDSHVHINEPGRTDWEGFETATRGAAAGGVTTLVDMPLNSVPSTTTLRALEAKRRAARGRCHVDVGFWGGVVPGNASQLPELHDSGVLGFKCFLSPSGVAEFPHVTEADLREALPVLKSFDGLLLVHAESPHVLDSAARRVANSAPDHYATYLESRPPEAEETAVAMLIDLAREFDTRVHVVHVSSAGTLRLLSTARREGVRISGETCPHYLCFDADAIPTGATEFKCAPPVREQQHREALWTGLHEQVIGMIVSDHSPSPPEMKCRESGNFMEAWGGIASLQLGLAAIWSEGRRRGLSLEQVATWMAREPAKLAGLGGRKGAIVPGLDADLVVFDPDASFPVTETMLYHRHRVTPYLGRTLTGRVATAIVRGRRVFDRGEFGEPRGQLL